MPTHTTAPSTLALSGVTALDFAKTINGYAPAQRRFLTHSLTRMMGHLPGIDEDQEAALGTLISWLSHMAIADEELAVIPFDHLDVPAVADRAAKLAAGRDFAQSQLASVAEQVSPATISTLVAAVERLTAGALAGTTRTLH